ncbi:MAG: agmatinase [Candidatus Omnitrophota bacterium]
MDDKDIMMTPSETKPAGNFAGIDGEYGSFKKAKAVIVQVPYDRTVTYIKGTKDGPAAIISASQYMELFDDELNQETFRIGINTMSPLEVESLAPEAVIEKVYLTTQELLKAGKFPVILGGEHSISSGAVKAMKEAYPNISVLHLDAHYDMRDELKGSKFNHGCIARRISEICPIVQAGVRSLSKEEKDFLTGQTASGRVKTFDVYDILDTPMWKDRVSGSLTENVYITIDLDVFDPSLMPAVGTPEPGGIGWYEMLDLLREISKDKKIAGFDVVELCPISGQVASDFLAAKLIYRILGYIFSNKK